MNIMPPREDWANTVITPDERTRWQKFTESAREYLAGYGSLLIFFIVMSTILLIFVLMANRLTPSDFERRNAIVQDCLQSELYSREECIQLAGGQPK